MTTKALLLSALLLLAPSAGYACGEGQVSVEFVNRTPWILADLRLAKPDTSTYGENLLAGLLPIASGDTATLCVPAGDWDLRATDLEVGWVLEMPRTTFQAGDPVIFAE